MTAVLTAASGAFAQITLDLDVLSDLPDTPAPPKKQRKVRLTEPKKDKTAARKKNETAKKDSGPKTQKQPQQQQAQPKRRPAKIETPAAKYQVKESARQDEHDKLKPRANPVPVVKIIKSTPTETAKTETAANETPERPQTESAAVAGTGVITPFAADGPLAADILRRSVYPVEGKLGRKGRSIMLSREIPAESATAKAIGRGLLLYDIFLFEDRSSDLTDEMTMELVAVAEEMRKEPKRRLLLLSYSGTTSPERGRERQLSLRRALAVRTALTQLGVRSLRIELRSQGQKGAGEKMPNRVDILFDD